MRTRSLMVGYFHPIFLTNSDTPQPQWADSTHLPLHADWVILYLDSDTFGADRSWIHQRRHELLTHGYQQVDQADTLVLLHR